MAIPDQFLNPSTNAPDASLGEDSLSLNNTPDVTEEVDPVLQEATVKNPYSTVEQAKNALLNYTTKEMTVADAKQALMGYTTPAKKVGLIFKQIQKEVLLGEQGPSLGGIPFAYLTPENQAKALRIEQEKQAAEERNKRAWISDEYVDTALGKTANVALQFTAGVGDVASGLLTMGARTINALNSLGLSQEDYDTYNSIINKRESGQQLSEAEQKWANTQIGGEGSTGNTKFGLMQQMKAREGYIQTVEDAFGAIKSRINDRDVNAALAKVENKSQQAIDQFGKGDWMESVGTYLGAVRDLAVKDTGAAVELTANTLPQMYVLAKNAFLGVTGLTTTGYDQAIADFKTEYGRMPTNEEKAYAGLFSLASASLDVVGAKAVFGGKALVDGLKASAAKLGINTAKATVEAAESATKEVSKSLIKKSLGVGVSVTKKVAKARPVKAPVVEGATETSQSVLSQLAATQDLSKVDLKEALTEGAVGAVAGFGISSGVTATEYTVKSPQKLSQGAKVAAEALDQYFAEKGVADLAKVIVTAKETNNPDLAIEAITRSDWSKMDYKQRRSVIADLTKFVEQHEKLAEAIKDPEERASALKQNDIYRQTINEVTEIHNRLSTDVDIVTAVNNIVNPPKEQPDAEFTKEDTIKNSIVAVTSNVTGTTDLNLDQITKVLGSEEFDANATPEEKQLVEGYGDLLQTQTVVSEAVDTAEKTGKTAAEVNNDVINGGKGFLGIKNYQARLNKAVATENVQEATAARDAITEFLNKQRTKLEQGYQPGGKGAFIPHKPHIADFIKKEIAALEAAETHFNNVLKERFNVKPEAKAEAKPTPKPQPEKKAQPAKKPEAKKKQEPEKAKPKRKYVLTRENINQVRQRLGSIPQYIQEALGKEFTDARVALKALTDAVEIPDAVFNKVRNQVQALSTKIVALKKKGPPKKVTEETLVPAPKQKEEEEESDILDLTDPTYVSIIKDLKVLTDKEAVTYEGYFQGEEIIVVRALDTELKQVDRQLNGLIQILEECA